MGRAGRQSVAACQAEHTCSRTATAYRRARQSHCDQPAHPATADLGSTASFPDGGHHGPANVLEFDRRGLGAQGPARAGCGQRRNSRLDPPGVSRISSACGPRFDHSVHRRSHGRAPNCTQVVCCAMRRSPRARSAGCSQSILSTTAKSRRRRSNACSMSDHSSLPSFQTPRSTPISKSCLFGIIRALTAAIDAKDPYTSGHSERVARIAVRLAEELRMPPAKRSDLYLAGLLHDVGKIGIDDGVLKKTGPSHPKSTRRSRRTSRSA